MDTKYFGVWHDERAAIKVGPPRATEEGALSAAQKEAGEATVTVVEADSKAAARIAFSETALVEPTQEEIDEARAEQPETFYFAGGLTADGTPTVGEIGHTLIAEAREDAESEPLFLPMTAVVIQATDADQAREALAAVGGVMPSDGLIVAGDVKRRSRPKPEAMSQEEIEAVEVPEDKTMFLLSATGMLYAQRYTVRSGVVDVYFADTPHMEDLSDAKDAGELVGSLKGVRVKDLHSHSCRVTARETEVDATASA